MLAGTGFGLTQSGQTRGLIALDERFDDGGGNETRDRIIGARRRVRSREHRRGSCRGLLSVRQLSWRLRCKTGRRAAAAAGRPCRGDPGRRCTRRRSATRNSDEPWRSGQPRGQALRAPGLTCTTQIESFSRAQTDPGSIGPAMCTAEASVRGCARTNVGAEDICRVVQEGRSDGPERARP
jgi:hypothetical protein